MGTTTSTTATHISTLTEYIGIDLVDEPQSTKTNHGVMIVIATVLVKSSMSR